jgi:hypothetical protein
MVRRAASPIGDRGAGSVAAMPDPAADSRPVGFSTQGPPTTVLDLEPAEARAALADAVALDDPAARRRALAAVVARWPRYLDGWARLGEHAAEPVERYAYFRVGYHRGLDRLRANGWRGSGYVRWEAEPNRGFLRALRGLQRAADAIGEADEAERCALFLAQLDPGGVPDDG